MQLSLDKTWYMTRIAREGDLDVTAGIPAEAEQTVADTCELSVEGESEGGLAGLHVFGSFVQMLRRDRRLSVEQLAAQVRVDTADIVSIERDPRFVPKPRTIHQLATYFQLPDRALAKLSNITTVHNPRLKDAAVRFAANSDSVMELSREERDALAEFVKVLASERAC